VDLERQGFAERIRRLQARISLRVPAADAVKRTVTGCTPDGRLDVVVYYALHRPLVRAARHSVFTTPSRRKSVRYAGWEICPELADFEGARNAREGHYKQRSWSAGLESFRATRASNLALLRGLDKEQWQRRGSQQGVGPISMCDMPSLMAEHDDAHRTEIDEWLRQQAQTPQQAGQGDCGNDNA